MRILAALLLAACCAAADNVRAVASAEEFDRLIAQAPADTTVLVDFWAEWCGPCKLVAPVLDELARENPKTLLVLKVDVDRQPALAQRFQVNSIPALHRFKGGKPVDATVGFQPKERLATWLGL